MTEPRTEPRNRICRSHCTRCNLCFAGDTAFDMHITHEGEMTWHNCPDTMRYGSGKRVGQPKFESVTGTCDHQPGCWSNGKRVATVPVTIYRVAMTDQQKAGLAALNGVAK